VFLYRRKKVRKRKNPYIYSSSITLRRGLVGGGNWGKKKKMVREKTQKNKEFTARGKLNGMG